MIGIYRIKNLVNGKCYYGSSKNIKKRWKTHLNQLRKNKHINSILQNAWNKYGETNFVFELVEECNLKNLFEVEQKYLDESIGYNIGKKACGGDNITNNPNKGKIIENIKQGSKLWLDNLSEEEKKKMFSKPLEKNPNWKGGSTFNYCECGKRIGYGHIHCNKCRPRSGENNPFYNKIHTKELKDKFSLRMKGKYHGEQNNFIMIDGIEYRSAGEASKILNIPMTTIRWRCLSKNPKYKNYHYKGENKLCYSNEEQKERLGNPHKGTKRKFNKPFLIDGIEYRTLKEASNELGIHQSTIKGRLLSTKFDNYKYIS